MTGPSRPSPPVSRSVREPDRVQFALVPRDQEILAFVNDSRYATTSHIRRYVFPENRSPQSCRRRVKALFHHGYLERVQPLVVPEKGSSELAYCLGWQGREFLKGHGVAVKSFQNRQQVRQQFLQHALDVTEFRVVCTEGLRRQQLVTLRRYVADFELKSRLHGLVGLQRRRLYTEVVHPCSPEPLVVFPDSMLILQGLGEFEAHKRVLFLEIDRGTMPIRRLQDKVLGYDLYHQQGIHKKFANVASFTVLFQTSSEKRARNIRRGLMGISGTNLVWVTAVQQVTAETILFGDIWRDHEGKSRSILVS